MSDQIKISTPQPGNDFFRKQLQESGFAMPTVPKGYLVLKSEDIDQLAIDAIRYQMQKIYDECWLTNSNIVLCLHQWKHYQGLNAIVTDYEGIGQAYVKCTKCGKVE